MSHDITWEFNQGNNFTTAACSSTPYNSSVRAVLRKHSSASLCFSPLAKHTHTHTQSYTTPGTYWQQTSCIPVATRCNELNYLCCGCRSSTLDRRSSSCSGMKWHFERYPGSLAGQWSPISAAGDWERRWMGIITHTAIIKSLIISFSRRMCDLHCTA